MSEKKFIVLLLFSFSLHLNILAQGIYGNILCPEVCLPGRSIAVTLEITKPYDLQSYATFKQELPPGFSAHASNTTDATFVQEGNLLKISWIKLPQGERVSFTYTLKAPANPGKYFRIGGTIVYTSGSNRGVFTLKKKRISTFKPTAQSNNETTNYLLSIPAVSPKKVNCKRSIRFNAARKMYECKLHLTKKEITRYHLCEKIPAGFSLLIMDSGGAEIIEDKRLVQFLWSEYKLQKTATVRYRLIPQKTSFARPVIYGKLSLLKNNQIVNLNVVGN
ncbi:MAG: hypothetical protein CSB06_01920 [Bacteroidia bacterium]|nr:MAG: hypothetical protein CSB06_01920 [Bacteroidia bacterium]